MKKSITLSQACDGILRPRPQAWRDVQALIEEKKARPYHEAVALLVKLRDLALFQNQLPEFQAKMTDLQARYASRPAFQERLHKARLV